MKIVGYRRSFLRALLGIAVLILFVLTIRVVLLSVVKSFPLETLIIATILAVCGIAIVLYIGELIIVCWIVDFLSEIGMPKIIATAVPLEYEQVGEIVVVTLRNNVASVRQCLSVQNQLKSLIDEHHCNFVLDFFYAEKTSKSFRGVMINLMKAARKEAKELGKPYRSIALPHGAVFKVFNDKEGAVEEMSKYDGHGWVVLCSVPVGIRAVSDLT
jgi:hypothetical protein